MNIQIRNLSEKTVKKAVSIYRASIAAMGRVKVRLQEPFQRSERRDQLIGRFANWLLRKYATDKYLFDLKLTYAVGQNVIRTSTENEASAKALDEALTVFEKNPTELATQPVS